MTIKQLQKSLNYNFTDEQLLQWSLTHRSFSAHNNERLEFLGDALLNSIIAQRIFTEFPDATEGELTRMRAHLVCEETLTEIAREFNLGEMINLGPGERRTGGHHRASILADCLEAIIGSIYLDCGKQFAVLAQVVVGWYGDQFGHLRDKSIAHPKDPKTLLQEYMQARDLPLPSYTVVRTEGKSHSPIFYVECNVSVLPEPVIGKGASRRKAEREAAELIINRLKNETK